MEEMMPTISAQCLIFLFVFVFYSGQLAAQTINGFTGIFAPSNWVVNAEPNSDATFTNDQLTIEGGFDDILVAYTFPMAGQLSFDYYIEQENSIIEDIIIIDLEGNIIVNLEDTGGANPFVLEDTLDEAVEAGWTIQFIIDGDGFNTGGVTSLIEVTNWVFAAPVDGGGGEPLAVPALGRWGLVALAMLLALLGSHSVRQHRRTG